jgi:uncharacterized coiled-coil DUF342 family protein
MVQTGSIGSSSSSSSGVVDKDAAPSSSASEGGAAMSYVDLIDELQRCLLSESRGMDEIDGSGYTADSRPSVDLAQSSAILSHTSKLYEEYRRMASGNIVNRKILQHLREDVEVVKEKRKDLSERCARVTNEYHAASKKLLSLKGLANQLSARSDEADRQTSEGIRAEQEQRLALSQGFSVEINKISEALEGLVTRRHAAVSENNRLKELLSICLEEFKALSDGDATTSDGTANASVDSGVIEEINLMSEGPQQDESTCNKLMEIEDLSSRLYHLSLVEREWKVHVLQQSQQFDEFQQQLTSCNETFHTKQSSIEALYKEIQTVESAKAAFIKRVSECVSSTKTQMDVLHSAKTERDKYAKLTTTCSSLLNTLSKDIEENGGTHRSS